MSLWVRDVELTDEQYIALRHAPRPALAARNRQRREHHQRSGRTGARRGEPLHAAGCMLFWAEGSKRRDAVQIVNSDPEMLRVFLAFLRHYFDIPDEKVRVRCSLFADHARRQFDIEQFWLDALSLPRSCLTKSIVNVRSRSSRGTRDGRLPYGTCRVTVHDVRIAQHLYGAIQEYGGFDRPEWL